MRRYLFIAFTLLYSLSCISQKTIEKALEQFNTGSVPYVTVNELNDTTDFILLDTRKKEEFQISHLEDAIWAGFQKFNMDSIQAKIPDTTTPIVVYCSIGVRSEKIGEKLQKAGYHNVKNLYGGIFEWKNQGNAVVDSLNRPTERVHAFSKHWGKLLTKGDKVYSLEKEQLENQH